MLSNAFINDLGEALGKHLLLPLLLPPKMAMKLTQRTIANLPLPEDRGKEDVLYFDDALTGFGIRFRRGKPVWIVQYRIGRKQRRMTLAAVDRVPVEQARAKAKTLLAQAALGTDPQAEKYQPTRRTSSSRQSLVY